MKRYIVLGLALGLVLPVAGCAFKPTDADYSEARNAPRPTSDDAANKAVVAYFNGVLKDPDSAKYTFRSPANGVANMGSYVMRGWFMCGTINAKNSYGGYTGAEPFLAHFSETSADTVVDGTVDADEYNLIGNICSGLYGY